MTTVPLPELRSKLDAWRGEGVPASDGRYRLLRELRYVQNDREWNAIFHLDSELFEVWEEADGTTGTAWREGATR